MRPKQLAKVPSLFFRDSSKKGPVLSDQEIQAFLLGALSETERKNKEVSVLDSALLAPYDKSREIPKDKLTMDKESVLSNGEFGCVYKAVMQLFESDVCIEVAVKVPKINCMSMGLRDLLSEVKIMTYLGSHPNIVGLVGAYTGELPKGVIYVVTELCSLGSLESFLRKHRDHNNNDIGESGEINYDLTRETILFKDRVQWSHEIACGMKHLEQKQVVHADLATRNILLTAERTAKIADFGIFKRMNNYGKYMKTDPESLPWQWISIEALSTLDFSSETDVWSYGVTLWEIFSNGSIPYPGLSWSDDFVRDLSYGLRPSRPQFACVEIFRLMQACWKHHASERPSFSELVAIFLQMRKKGRKSCLYSSV